MAELDTLDITIVRSIDAPREDVFNQWLSADAVAEWFPPETWRTVSSTMDGRPGGRWHLDYVSEDGETLAEYGVIREVQRPHRLVMSLTQIYRGETGPETRIVVDFDEEPGERTRMTFHQSGFDTAGRRDGNEEGWSECFDKLSHRLETIR